MANDYIDQWDLNTVVYDIHDKGRGQPNGVATLDENGRVPYEQLPESALNLKGYWDASTNTPTLADGTGTSGDFYFVSVAGTQDLGSGSQYFAVGDRVLYDGSVWRNIAGGTVRTINGQAPDSQGNISGVVTSVNTVTPDASGNITLTAMLSVNGVNPDNTGNINIKGKVQRIDKSYTISRTTGSGFSDADWAEILSLLRNSIYVRIPTSMGAFTNVDDTQIAELTYDTFCLCNSISSDEKEFSLYPITGALEDSTTLYGWAEWFFIGKNSKSYAPPTQYRYPALIYGHRLNGSYFVCGLRNESSQYTFNISFYQLVATND